MFPSSLASYFFGQIREGEDRADRIYEAVVGVVTDNKDPDKLGRVKVHIPTLPEQDQSWWAPVAAPGAGNDRGWFFLPEIDDEVLVLFAHGDVRRPVVLGAIWNGKDKPSDKNDGNNERRTIVSREGSKITFDDDKKTITLEDGGGIAKLVIEEKKITLEAMSGDVCLMAPDGALNIVADEMTAAGDQNYHLEAASGGLGLGGSDVKMKGGTMLKVGGAKLNIQGGGAQDPQKASASCQDTPDPAGT